MWSPRAFDMVYAITVAWVNCLYDRFGDGCRVQIRSGLGGSDTDQEVVLDFDSGDLSRVRNECNRVTELIN